MAILWPDKHIRDYNILLTGTKFYGEMNAENQELIQLVAKLHYHNHWYNRYGSKSSLATAKHYEERVDSKMHEVEFVTETPPPRFKLRVNRYSYPVFSF